MARMLKKVDFRFSNLENELYRLVADAKIEGTELRDDLNIVEESIQELSALRKKVLDKLVNQEIIRRRSVLK